MTKNIATAILTLKSAIESNTLTPTDVKDIKKLCNKAGAGVSKTRVLVKKNKANWLESKPAKTLASKFPDKKTIGVIAWNVAHGTRIRPNYIGDNDVIFEKSLDYIETNYM